ncbi:DNA-dependent metalloprotease WSS1 [Dichotomopilus funicola]|uniref:DNA-dependent metalloprotease WSS1 n=1 Tax=Dichotomopilus funicola TaxID=1934379 RepID=A0AAN6VAA7_9PEZI|nr:DNA-dependent metalloprotease WSS1 [Dichotomopilus funicola]
MDPIEAAPEAAPEALPLDSLNVTDDASAEITIKFPPEKHNQTWIFSPTDTFEHLLQTLSLEFPSYDWSKAKALPEKPKHQHQPNPDHPKLKPLYTPSSDASLPLSNLHQTTLRLLAPQLSALTTLQTQHTTATTWQAKRALTLSRYSRLPQSQRATAADLSYTFHTLRPLPHLPNPDRSLAFLERLKSDPGIRAAMRKRHFSVGLLTEMDPSANTSASHEGVTRILGLNRNKGEVIELRLRTDAYDGWRDYKTIRRTLCHELTHNVFSEHDGQFWALCREIEREVERGDWKSGGKSMGGGEFAPERGVEEEGMVMDHGGWEGGTYVLGGGGGGSTAGSGGNGENGGLTAREVRARAAEARWSNLEKATRQGGQEKGAEEEKE